MAIKLKGWNVKKSRMMCISEALQINAEHPVLHSLHRNWKQDKLK